MAAEGGDDGITVRSFSGHGGAEYFIAVTIPGHSGLDDQIALVQERYAEAGRSLGLAPETAVFRRLFLSDALNQTEAVRASGLAGGGADGPVAVSVIQQPPLPGAKLALLAYHIGGAPITKHRLSPKHLLVRRNGGRDLWSTGLCTGAGDQYVPVAQQTRGVFDALIATLADQGGTLRDHCLRTWIYVRDIDLFYMDMVDNRRALFAEQGMGAGRRTITSTGIGGVCAHRYDLVAMDAYSALDLVPGQVSYLNDFERMCRPRDYYVTFERGTRVAYADRSHLLVSGTASVNAAGRVVHAGDVRRQLGRTLENVEAVLKAGSATLADLMYVIVYLRDPTDFPRIRGFLAERLPGVPAVVVQGAVCRREWLIEVEGVAVAANDAPALPGF